MARRLSGPTLVARRREISPRVKVLVHAVAKCGRPSTFWQFSLPHSWLEVVIMNVFNHRFRGRDPNQGQI